MSQSGPDLKKIATSASVTRRWFDSRLAGWLYLFLLALPVLLLNSRGFSQHFVADDWYLLWDTADKGYNGQLFWLGWGYVRPIGVLTWKIGYALFGLNPTPFYVFALLLQLLNTWLVYSIVTRWLNVRWLGFMTGLLFCTYYLGWEPTLWLSSSFFDVQSTFFMLLAFRLFLVTNHLDTKTARIPKILLPILVVICYFLATFSKETGLTLLPICLLYDLLYRRCSLNWRSSAIFYGAMGLVAASFFVAHYWPGTKLTTGDVIHPDQIWGNLLYHLEGLYLLPVYPFSQSGFELIKSELKFGIWLFPAIMGGLYLLYISSYNKGNKKFESGQKLTGSWLASPAGKLFSFGFVWSLCSSLATLGLDYHTLRFLYAAHIGAVFSGVGLLAMVVARLQTLDLPKIARLIAVVSMLYLIGVLSVGGIIGFWRGSEIYAKSSDFTRRFVSLAHQQMLTGATDLTFVNLPKTIDLPEADQPNIFYDQLNPPLVLLLELGFDRQHVHTLRTADLPQLGWDAVGDKTAPDHLPVSTATRPVIRVVRTGAGNYQFLLNP